tara:strand:+ start:115 stop:705 length:591 start_codon:yes stop_codon:yes gene_type:complete
MYPITVKRNVASPAEPVTLTEAKHYLRVTSSADNNYINQIIGASRESIEISTSRAIVAQTIDFGFKSFPQSYRQFRLPVGGVGQTITHIKYKADGVSVTLDSTMYSLHDNAEGVTNVIFNDKFEYPTLDADYETPVEVKVSYDPAGVYKLGIVQAVYLMIANFYEMRVPISLGAAPFKVPLGIEHLISQYRVRRKI